MPVPTFTVTCTKNVLIARGIYEFTLTKPSGFSFEPGQYVLFDVPLLENPSDIQTRAFSIASTPDETELLFLAKLIPGGRMSRFVEQSLAVGTEVVIKGPFGRFVLDRSTDKDYLFVATSSGLAPFRSQILSALGAGDRRDMHLIFGVRSEEDLFWTDFFEKLAHAHPNLHFHPALSAGSPHWKGHRGRVQAVIPQIVTEFPLVSLYACGNPAMTKDVKALALEKWGMSKQDVHVEGYI